MSDPAGYTVGWICALPVEYLAAQEFLDEEHEKPSFVSPHDDNDYKLGRIGDHNVVIAVLPGGDYGTASAASVAANMRTTFYNVRIRLMVGIGGGVPSKKHDVRLGDVVVSAPYGGNGGVFQNDFGKSIQDQDFQHTRFLNQPPSVLRAAVTGIQIQYKRRGHQLEEAVSSKLDKNRRLRREFGRPELTTDRLFRSDVVHRSKCGAASCAYDDTSNLVLRPARTEDEDNPAIHYGLIASSNQLMKDALLRDKLAATRDVLCFEMEAAGLMNTFSCLVIRGICDYSDSHKNKEWQGYAAMVAAAYAKDLLQRMPVTKLEAEKMGVTTSGKDVPQRTSPNSDQAPARAYDQRERHQEEQKRAWTEEQQRYHQVSKTSSYEEQKDINPCQAKGTSQSALQGSESPRDLGLSKLDIREDKARPASNYHGPTRVLETPAAEKSVLQHHRNRVKPILGVPLIDLYHRDGTAVPVLLSRCFHAVENFGLDRVGIYRLTASDSDVNRIKSAFETDAPEVDLGNPKNVYQNISSIAGLVKRFLEELPDPVFTRRYYSRFIDAARIDNDIRRRDSLQVLINGLPRGHYEVARALFQHLEKVRKHSAQNRMPLDDLALCFASSLTSGISDSRHIHPDADWQLRIVRTVLENVLHIFR